MIHLRKEKKSKVCHKCGESGIIVNQYTWNRMKVHIPDKLCPECLEIENEDKISERG